MKKRYFLMTLTTMFLAMAMMLSGVSSVFAAVDAGKAYDYTVTVYAGQQGHFEQGKASGGTVTDGGKTWTMTAKPGDRVVVSLQTTGYVQDNTEYYVRGFRETGHDNDEKMASPSFTAWEDVSYEVAYGLAGGMVKYKVKYVDLDGNKLHDTDEYYGMVGDKPIVSYRYVDGYHPNAYNMTKTLKEDEEKNVFTFTYTKLKDLTGDGDQDLGHTDNGLTDNGTASTIGADEAGDEDEMTEEEQQQAERRRVVAATTRGITQVVMTATQETVAELLDLDDMEGPLAGGSGQEKEDKGIGAAGIAAAAVGIAALAGLGWFLFGRRKKEDEQES